jgi:hypothetical protein
MALGVPSLLLWISKTWSELSPRIDVQERTMNFPTRFL